MKFPIDDFFSKCDQIRRKLRIWLHLLRKFLIENFIFCAVLTPFIDNFCSQHSTLFPVVKIRSEEARSTEFIPKSQVLQKHLREKVSTQSHSKNLLTTVKPLATDTFRFSNYLWLGVLEHNEFLQNKLWIFSQSDLFPLQHIFLKCKSFKPALPSDSDFFGQETNKTGYNQEVVTSFGL